MSNQRRLIQEKDPRRGMGELTPTPASESHIEDTLGRIEDVLGYSMQEGDVYVISGANSQPFPVATRTVREARTMLQQVMNIGPEAVALVNGIPASPGQILHQNDLLEFIKEGGEKGGRSL